MAFHEQIAPDEGERFERFAKELRALQESRRQDGYTPRGLHAKAHVAAVGQLTVPELPAHLRVALFAQPRTWPLYARFSNGSPARQHDGVPDIRGIALKIVGVAGRKIIPGLEDAKTQDFLFIQVPKIAFRTPDEFVTFVKTAAKGQALLLPRLVGALGFGRTLTIVKGLASMPKVASMATARFYTAAPLRFGDTAAKLALFPLAGDARRGPTLRDDLLARLGAGPVEYSLRAQLFVDDANTPIEDMSVAWPEEKAPFVEIGRVTLPRQDANTARGAEIDGLVEKLSFDPWHAVEELRPLGAVMRARAPAYRESVIARGAAPEPDSVIALE
ncbi:MAG TPA: hypothetical protein VLW85_15060 [Myxococcales bacterium]|nr:hypothetical protein [Myxococcales bacterium]